MFQHSYQNQYSIYTIILGAQSSGKTSLMNSLKESQDYGNQLSSYWSSKELGRSQIDLQFQEFSTAEIDERFILEISQSDYPLIIVLLFDVSNPNSFQELVSNYYINQILKEIGISQGRFILVGTKSDLQYEVQDNDITSYLSQSQNISYQNASPMTNKGINELKKSLFNLAKQQILQVTSHASTRSKWESMEENGESQWSSELSQNSQSKYTKRVAKQPKHPSQFEQVMTFLDEYKNNIFDNKMDSSFQDEEQSMNSQFGEYTDAVTSQCDHQHQNDPITHQNSYTSNEQKSKSDQEEYDQGEEQDELHDFKSKTNNNGVQKNIDQLNNKIQNGEEILEGSKQQIQMEKYFLSIGKKQCLGNKFISQHSNTSSSSSYSQIYDKKKIIATQHSKQHQIQTDDCENSCYNSSEKWEIGVLEQMKGINDSKSTYSDQLSSNLEGTNNLFTKKSRTSSIALEQQQQNINQTQNGTRVYAMPQKRIESKENEYDTYVCSAGDNSNTFNLINEQDDSQDESEEEHNLRYHQIHSHKNQQLSQQISKEFNGSTPLKQRNGNIQQQEMSKSSTYLVKLDLESGTPNEKYIFKSINQKPKRSISPLNTSSLRNSSSKLLNDKENIQNRDKTQVNSFLKKKDLRYLMNLCLHYQGQQIYIDVMKDECSFDIAHKFCKKVNIHPTILQIKNISKVIQQQIDDYAFRLDEQLQNIEREVLYNSKQHFESQMGVFLKENKNFLQDINNPSFNITQMKLHSSIQPQSSKQHIPSRQNSIKNVTPTKTNLYVRSKSPTPIFKAKKNI